MNRGLRCAVEFGRRFVRVVVCDAGGHVELDRYTWEKSELALLLPAAVTRAEQEYGLAVRVTGRSEAPWPPSVVADLTREGLGVDLIGGPWLRDLLYLVRAHREDTRYETACFLAACASSQERLTDIDAAWHFVVDWLIQRHRDRGRFLDLARPCSDLPAWLRDETPPLPGPVATMRGTR